jgi:hypothetical protein
MYYSTLPSFPPSHLSPVSSFFFSLLKKRITGDEIIHHPVSSFRLPILSSPTHLRPKVLLHTQWREEKRREARMR